MATKLQPFNIKLMELPPSRLATIRPTTVIDIYDGASAVNFHSDGLYSVQTFGRVGSPERMTRFSYVKLNTEILHPFVVRILGKIKSLYRGILSGKEYAVWDAKEKDFVASSASNKDGELVGETGYTFFMKHWLEIKFKTTESEIRKLNVELLDKYRKTAITQNWLILPAGMRDLTIDKKGIATEDEINDYYRRLIAISRAINPRDGSTNDIYDNARWSLTLAATEICEIIERLLSGKKGLIQGKWGRRAVFNGTRNVITGMDMDAVDLHGPNAIKITDTVVGLFQTLKGALPVVIHHLKKGILSEIISNEAQVYLVDKRTLKSEAVNLQTKTFDLWGTNEGLEQLIDQFSNAPKRHDAIEIEDHYLALMYQDDQYFKIFRDIDELPERLDRKNVRPLTYCELMYLCNYSGWNKLRGVTSRYPILGLGSIYPTTLYIKTTLKGLALRELDHNWEPLEGDEYLAAQFPDTVNRGPFMETLACHPSAIQGLGADYDGDMMSLLILTTDQALKEIDDYFNSRIGIIGPRGKLNFQVDNDPVRWAAKSMTR